MNVTQSDRFVKTKKRRIWNLKADFCGKPQIKTTNGFKERTNGNEISERWALSHLCY